LNGSRIRPFDELAFFASAITVGRPLACFARSAPNEVAHRLRCPFTLQRFQGLRLSVRDDFLALDGNDLKGIGYQEC
jgi:hypothetical protein